MVIIIEISVAADNLINLVKLKANLFLKMLTGEEFWLCLPKTFDVDIFWRIVKSLRIKTIK